MFENETPVMTTRFPDTGAHTVIVFGPEITIVFVEGV